MDQRQRLATDVKQSLSEITTLDSPGDQSQSMGFSVLWDASNTQPDAAAGNALTPDGKKPVSKATEKRRQRLAEEQDQRRQEEEKRMLQQRRQQTIREIRQRQAAAAEAAGRAASSSAAPSEAENDSSRRAVPGQQQDGVTQRAANRQQPFQARAGYRSSPQVCQAKAPLPSAGAARKLAPKATTNSAVDTASNQKQRPAERRVSLRTGSKCSSPVQTAQISQRLNRSNACDEGSIQQGSMHRGSASASAQQQRFAAASVLPPSQNSAAEMPRSVDHPGYPVSTSGPQEEGGQQQQQSPVVGANTAGRVSASHAQTASQNILNSLSHVAHKSHE